MPVPLLVLPDLFALSARPDSLAFSPMRPGVEIHRLWGDPPEGPGAALLRYAPGASIPAHQHVGHEQILVLAGSQSDERGLYRAGTLIVNAPGSGHAVHSAEGCLVLVVWELGIKPRAA
jgi:anti-sigma factor ChrR (cupin superfamily)